MAPDPALITAKGWRMINDLPPIAREDPDTRAIIHCHAKETERQEEALTELVAQFMVSTATELGLPWWETLLRTTADPVGLTVPQRRAILEGYMLGLTAILSRYGWAVAVERILGPGWAYQEYDPADPGGPPANTIRLIVPFPPTSTIYQETRRLIRQFTDAHLALEMVSLVSFPLDAGLLDVNELG